MKIYEGNTLKGQSVTDAQGLFKVSYTGSQAGQATLNLRARACVGGTCSDFTQVSLTQSQSFWDPQRSWWEGDPIEGPMAGQHVSFKFREPGWFGQQPPLDHPRRLRFLGYHLASLCLRGPALWHAAHPDVDQGRWTGLCADFLQREHVYLQNRHRPTHLDPAYLSNLIPHPTRGTPTILLRRLPPGYPPDPWPLDDGMVMIDPDGYVFNSTLGFDPQNPTQHVISGTRVTCMAFLPGWGGWVPWPAHLYDNQINPQVVGSNGYFAFFVPPGQYYLQVEGARWFSSLAQSGRGSGQ